MSNPRPSKIAIIGGGPAGLMAAESLTGFDCQVDVYDAMPSFGRKLLMAGKSGLNLTHSETYDDFVGRYGTRADILRPALDGFTPDMLRDWALGLGIETFTGSSGRIFPTHYKASPLLRAWLNRLAGHGVGFHRRHKWKGWLADGNPAFETPEGRFARGADAVILAVGGISWPKLGSDGAWQRALSDAGVEISPFRPANCGFSVAWSDHFRDRFSGDPVKTTALSVAGRRLQGEFVISKRGVEGSAIYAHSARLRDMHENEGAARLTLDLLPDLSPGQVKNRLTRPRGADSLSNHLRKTLGLKGVKMGLVREFLDKEQFTAPDRLAQGIKALPVPIGPPHPIEEAISCAGGVSFEAMDEHFMLKNRPGTFCAGEMTDWEAPTGGYLLNACFAMGKAAGLGAARWLKLSIR